MSDDFKRNQITRRSALTAMTLLAVTKGASAYPSAGRAPEVSVADDRFERIESGGLAPVEEVEVYPGVWRIHFGLKSETFSPLSVRTAEPRVGALKALPASGPIPFDISEVSWTLSSRGVSIQLPMQSDERIYGLGLDTDVFDMTNRRAICAPSDTPQDKMNYSHAPVPFYISSRGYGVYVNSARYVWFYTGDVQPKADATMSAGTSEAALNTGSLYQPQKLSRKTMMIDVHPARGVDIYVFGGPTPRLAVQRYNLFSGGGAVPPLWGLGVHYRSESMMPAEQIKALAKRIRRERMPCDIWGLEPGWQSRVYSSSFVWDSGRFPDPRKFIADMRAMHFHINMWEHAFVNPVSPMFKPLERWSGDYLVWGGLVPDFVTPQCRQIWIKHHEKIMFSLGVDGVKLDECDNQPYRAHPWSFPEASVFPSGLDGELMHSVFGQVYQQTMLTPLTRRNLRTWSLVRDTYALAAPLPFTIYSDSYDFNCYLRGVCKQAFSGVMWVPEVRNAKNVDELYRRVQLVIFSPVALINCWYMKLPPWLQIDRKLSNEEKMMPDHKEATAVVRRLFELRMSFIPYLYAAFNEYHRQGLPPIRPLVMDWPEDQHTAEIDNQFMFGPSVMVAPLEPGQTSRKVYFPAGDWYEFYTGEKIPGGRFHAIDKSPEEVPIFVKNNKILPLASPVQYVTSETCFELTAHIFGHQPAAITLYEDDGVSLDFASGKQNRVELAWHRGAVKESRQGGYTGPARYKIVGHQLHT
jgi:alpha-D-xyloside xylohydrolase